MLIGVIRGWASVACARGLARVGRGALLRAPLGYTFASLARPRRYCLSVVEQVGGDALGMGCGGKKKKEKEKEKKKSSSEARCLERDPRASHLRALGVAVAVSSRPAGQRASRGRLGAARLTNIGLMPYCGFIPLAQKPRSRTAAYNKRQSPSPREVAGSSTAQSPPASSRERWGIRRCDIRHQLGPTAPQLSGN